MGYQALLFCADPKTVRAVTLVLNDLEFSIECCSEPFAAVKKLSAEHFDAIVVDCDNEQNAALLFKGARNSASNSNSLAVAVVEGQAGIAKAFRNGANLVLSKPINVEQSKSTLRVARSLLRKADSSRPAVALSPQVAALHGASEPGTESSSGLFLRPPLAAQSLKAASASASASSPGLEFEAEPAPRLEAAEAALLESMPAAHPEEAKPGAATLRERSLQPLAAVADGASNTPAPAASAESRGENQLSAAASANSSKSTFGQMLGTPTSESQNDAARIASVAELPADLIDAPQVAKPSPAKAKKAGPAKTKPQSKAVARPVTKDIPAEADNAPDFSWAAALRDQEASDEGDSKRNFVIAAVLVVGLAVAAFFGWPRLQPLIMNSPLAQKYLGARLEPSKVATSPAEAAASPAASAQDSQALPADSSSTTSASAPGQPADASQTSAQTSGSGAQLPDAPNAAAASGPASTSGAAPAHAPVAARGETKNSAVSPSAPPALGSDSGSSAIAAIATAAPPSVPKLIVQPVHVSQVISEGLLLKRVPPDYPALARQMKVEGQVQLQATISKDGVVTNLKVVSGDAMLTHAATDAVRQWKYKPYQVTGEPVDILTPVTVSFKLP